MTTIGVLAERAAGLAERAGGRAIIGIAGAPGAGKSTLALRLVAALADRGVGVAHVPMDGFHLADAALERLGLRQRKGAPETFDAFGYLAGAYDLTQEGVSGLAPDAEPNPKRLAELTDLVEEKGVTTIFTEELVSPRIAQTLAREAGGLKTATLNPLEGLTAKELSRGDDYVSVMDTNLNRLRSALGCT